MYADDAVFDPAKYQHRFTALSYVGDAQSGAIEYASKMRTPGDFMGVEIGGQELTIRDAASVLRQLEAAR